MRPYYSSDVSYVVSLPDLISKFLIDLWTPRQGQRLWLTHLCVYSIKIGSWIMAGTQSLLNRRRSRFGTGIWKKLQVLNINFVLYYMSISHILYSQVILRYMLLTYMLPPTSQQSRNYYPRFVKNKTENSKANAVCGSVSNLLRWKRISRNIKKKKNHFPQNWRSFI